MFEFISTFFSNLCSFLISFFDILFGFPFQFISWLLELYIWLVEESFNVSVNLVYETINSVGSRFNPDFSLDRELFLSTLAKINVFFPVDLLFSYTFTLLTTWLAVNLFCLAVRLAIRFVVPKIPFVGHGG